MLHIGSKRLHRSENGLKTSKYSKGEVIKRNQSVTLPHIKQKNILGSFLCHFIKLEKKTTSRVLFKLVIDQICQMWASQWGQTQKPKPSMCEFNVRPNSGPLPTTPVLFNHFKEKLNVHYYERFPLMWMQHGRRSNWSLLNNRSLCSSSSSSSHQLDSRLLHSSLTSRFSDQGEKVENIQTLWFQELSFGRSLCSSADSSRTGTSDSSGAPRTVAHYCRFNNNKHPHILQTDFKSSSTIFQNEFVLKG